MGRAWQDGVADSLGRPGYPWGAERPEHVRNRGPNSAVVAEKGGGQEGGHFTTKCSFIAGDRVWCDHFVSLDCSLKFERSGGDLCRSGSGYRCQTDQEMGMSDKNFIKGVFNALSLCNASLSKDHRHHLVCIHSADVRSYLRCS